MTLRALSSHAIYPRAPIMCLQITGLILAYVALTCIILFAHVLVWFLMAVPRLPITFLWLVCLWLTCLLWYYTPPPFSTLPDPHLCHRYIMSHLYQKPYASSFDPILYLALFTVSDIVSRFRLRPPPIYKPLSRCLYLSSLTWSLILSLV